jgi:hypothetical protein
MHASKSPSSSSVLLFVPVRKLTAAGLGASRGDTPRRKVADLIVPFVRNANTRKIRRLPLFLRIIYTIFDLLSESFDLSDFSGSPLFRTLRSPDEVIDYHHHPKSVRVDWN